MIITFCGHASYVQKDGDEAAMLSLLEELIGDDPAELYLGGYGGFDAFAHRCGRKYKETHPNARLIFVTPYMTEAYQKSHLEPVKPLYDAIVYPPIESAPFRFAISYRNKWMVEQADVLIAYVIHEFGGAYARQKKEEASFRFCRPHFALNRKKKKNPLFVRKADSLRWFSGC